MKRLVPALMIGFMVLSVLGICGWWQAIDWRQNYYALAKVCDERYAELGPCLREVKRLDAGWTAETHDYDKCNRERTLCREAIMAGHKYKYEEPLLLDSDSEPPQLCWYGYCWDYEPEAY